MVKGVKRGEKGYQMGNHHRTINKISKRKGRQWVPKKHRKASEQRELGNKFLTKALPKSTKGNQKAAKGFPFNGALAAN